jgi:TRAP-type C4-dicarboxylate transport system permease small subunit
MILIVFCALAFQESGKEHIRVDMFVEMLPKVVGKVVNIVFDFFTVVAVGYLSYAYFIDIAPTRRSGAASSLMRIPEWPFRLVVAIAVLLFAITVLLHTIERFLPKDNEDKSEETPAQ